MDLLVVAACSWLLSPPVIALQEVVHSREAIAVRSEEHVNEHEATSKEVDRDSRGLLKKLSYLAGLKAGGGIVSSSGTLAASNSLRIFGKVMNTALSVSYGNVGDLDPLPEVQSDETHEGEEKKKVERGKLTAARQNLLKQHNTQVSRVNHKFLRTDPQPSLRVQ